MCPSENVHRPLRHEEIIDLLADIGEALHATGDSAHMYVAGGAALALRYGERARDVTHDVDALFDRDLRLLEEAGRIAAQRGLDHGWLNDHFRAFLPTAREDLSADTLRVGGLTVRIASPEILLAMKMHAARPKDLPDAVLLAGELDMRTAEEIAQLTIDLYGEHSVPAVDFLDVALYAELVLVRLRSSRGARESSPRPLTTPGGAQGRVPAGTSAGGRFTHRVNSPPVSSLG